MEERIEALEIKVAYLEKEVGDLNDLVVKMMGESEHMRRETEYLGSQLKALLEETVERPSQKPPHY